METAPGAVSESQNKMLALPLRVRAMIHDLADANAERIVKNFKHNLGVEAYLSYPDIPWLALVSDIRAAIIAAGSSPRPQFNAIPELHSGDVSAQYKFVIENLSPNRNTHYYGFVDGAHWGYRWAVALLVKAGLRK